MEMVEVEKNSVLDVRSMTCFAWMPNRILNASWYEIAKSRYLFGAAR